jgi:hypothetical protein
MLTAVIYLPATIFEAVSDVEWIELLRVIYCIYKIVFILLF